MRILTVSHFAFPHVRQVTRIIRRRADRDLSYEPFTGPLDLLGIPR